MNAEERAERWMRLRGFTTGGRDQAALGDEISNAILEEREASARIADEVKIAHLARTKGSWDLQEHLAASAQSIAAHIRGRPPP